MWVRSFFFGVGYEDVDVAIQILTVVSETRQATIDKVDVKPDVGSIEDLTHTGEQTELAKPGPSTEAISQLTDWSRCFARGPIVDTDEDFSDSLHEWWWGICWDKKPALKASMETL